MQEALLSGTEMKTKFSNLGQCTLDRLIEEVSCRRMKADGQGDSAFEKEVQGQGHGFGRNLQL